MRSNYLKTRVVLAAASAVACVATSAIAATTPLLSYNYNEGPNGPDGFAVNTGVAGNTTTPMTPASANGLFFNGTTTAGQDYHTASSTAGVTGRAGDYALDLSNVAGMGSVGNGNRSQRVTRPAINGLTSFTLSGWFKADNAQIGGSARLFALQDNAGAQAFQVSATANGVLGFNVDTAGTSTPAVYTEINQYVFFAVTYDGSKTGDNVVFYKGTTGGTFSTVTTQTFNVGAVDAIGSTTPFFLYVGNNNSALRQFDGLLDNIQVYGAATGGTGALSAADVQSVYASAIPEPTSLAAIAGAALLMRRRRR